MTDIVETTESSETPVAVQIAKDVAIETAKAVAVSAIGTVVGLTVLGVTSKIALKVHAINEARKLVKTETEAASNS